MIEVRVSDQHHVNPGHVVGIQAGVPEPLHRAMPECPVGINQDVNPFHLDKEARVPEPGDTNLMIRCTGNRSHIVPRRARGKQGGNQDIAKELKVTFPPPLFREQTYFVFLAQPSLREKTLFPAACFAAA